MPKSFVEALKTKYCEDEDESSSNFVVSFVFTNRPRKNSGGVGEAELGYLTSMVLSMNSITHAGIPSEGLASLCPNVTDLDISSNLIGCWDEVLQILQSLDRLKFVNLSGNRLQDPKNSLANLSGVRFGIENLVLNNTGVPWDHIFHICCCLPQLRELHASQNGYSDVPASAESLRECFQNLEVLHLTDNNFTRWEQVTPFSRLPALHTLMLSENPLSDIDYVFPVATNEDEDVQDENNVMEVCTDDQPVQDINDVVSEILDKLIEDASILSTKDTLEDPSSSPTHRASDPSYDSGMEDCQPNTPRRIPKERLSSQGSEDGDPCGDSGYGGMRQDNPLLPDKTVQVLPGISEHGAKRVSPSSLKSEDRKRKHSERKPVNASSIASESDKHNDEVLADINTDKFAYFEIAWDPDEAIGHEEEEQEEEEEEREEEMAEETHPVCPNTSFPSLKVLCVTNTKVNQWSDIESLRAFPRLESLRVKNVPFLKNLAMDERRKLLVASLPNIKTLNGSEIKEEEREKSERFFIRHFDENPEPPAWIEDLVKRHGNLKPITEIDIGRGFQEHAHLSFVYSGRCIHQATIHVVQNVSELRKYCAKLLDKPRRCIRMYHLSKCEPSGETELNLLHQDLLPMSRYDMTHGDEIHIETGYHQPLAASQLISKSFFVSGNR